VRWREAGTRRQRRVTLGSEQEAGALARYLDDNGQLPAQTTPAFRPDKPGLPTVADVVQTHIDLLVHPSSGTIGTYQRILDLHIRDMIGQIPVAEFGYG
jgi:hypothetical protein